MTDGIELSGREFGRLEEKVANIAANVSDLKTAVNKLDGRLDKIETGYAEMTGAQRALIEDNSRRVKAVESNQFRYQTLILFGSMAVAVVAVCIGLYATFH